MWKSKGDHCIPTGTGQTAGGLAGGLPDGPASPASSVGMTHPVDSLALSGLLLLWGRCRTLTMAVISIRLCDSLRNT